MRDTAIGYTGQRRSGVSGHYLLGNGYRGFNPVLKRFAGQDSLSPFGQGGEHGFAYCGGDPVNRSDSSGHIFGLQGLLVDVFAAVFRNTRRISEVLGEELSAHFERGALEGEGVVSVAGKGDIYSLNAQSCTIASIYDGRSSAGTILHIPTNDATYIDEAIDTALSEMGSEAGPHMRVQLVGSDWPSSRPIGVAVEESVRARGMSAEWHHWSLPCWGHSYGAKLDLSSGVLTVFSHDGADLSEFMKPLQQRVRTPGGRRMADFLYRTNPQAAERMLRLNYTSERMAELRNHMQFYSV
ncbi:RHS repeat-associated core domain-containing protein [Citrobacter freundii]|nr:RHS repeat-associated core domain-containing protein [Citrobacter freundii]